MKVAGEHQFTSARDDVWEALLDPAVLSATLPGARQLVPTGADEYAITVDVGVGSVKGTYEGVFSLTDLEPGEACTVRATASGRPGTVTAVARMRLGDGERGATLAYEADATVTGPLAGVGQRLMGAAARRTTEQFLTALDDLILHPSAPELRTEMEHVPAPRAGTDPKVVAASALGGFLLALIGVAVGRWTARR